MSEPATPPPSDLAPAPPARRWYKSLYWRLALGLFVFLVVMNVAQAALFFWMLDRSAGSMPARSPRRLAALVASDVADTLQATPEIDLTAYVHDQYGNVYRPFVVMLRSGVLISNHGAVPESLQEAVEFERRRGFGPPGGSEGRRGPPDGRRGPPDGRRGQSSLPPDVPWESAPIFVDRELVGRVVVLPEVSRDRMLRDLGPTVAAVALGVLALGMTLVVLGVFGPVRGRLKAVEEAAERLGQGDASVRAPERGGDEVAAVAMSFNRMADELARRADALETSDRARRQLLADVSHELMTPLTAMRGYVETLAMTEVALDASTRERYLGIIDTETHRLERIVGDLLDLAKLEGGGTPMRRETVPVASLFERVIERHEHDARTRGVQMHSDIEPGADTVEGDPDRLEQALQNLAANALRHTTDGGTITVSASAERDAVVLTVRDNGAGIPAEHLPHIFERFYKVDASRRAAGGSGLGLSIVKAIVERHHGSITARNDDGAVFEIRIPR